MRSFRSYRECGINSAIVYFSYYLVISFLFRKSNFNEHDIVPQLLCHERQCLPEDKVAAL